MNYQLSFFKRTIKQSQGQTLIEILIAIGLAMVVLSAMSIAVLTGLSNATLSKNQNLATEYAQEGIEIIKQMQLTDYGNFSSLSGRYCLAQTCSALDSTISGCWLNPGPNGKTTNCTTNINSQFIRQVDIYQLGDALPPGYTLDCSNTIEATVSVLWTDGKCSSGTFCHSEQVESCFTNPNPVQAP